MKAKTEKKTTGNGLFCAKSPSGSHKTLVSNFVLYSSPRAKSKFQSPIPKGLKTQKFETETKELNY